MAKKSSIEKNNRRAKMAKQYAGKRAKLKAMAVDDKLTPEDRFARPAQARRAAAQLLADARSQSVRDDRPSAGRLSQVQAVASCAA